MMSAFMIKSFGEFFAVLMDNSDSECLTRMHALPHAQHSFVHLSTLYAML